jgi:hypothetical protein
MVSESRKSGLNNSTFWDRQTNALPFGCASCAELSRCGGIRMDAAAWNCLDRFCVCTDPNVCSTVCPRSPASFVARVREVNGFNLLNIASAQRIAVPRLQHVIPMLYHGCSRVTTLTTASVAIPLGKMFNQATGVPRFSARAAVASSFRFDEQARIVIIGVDFDQPLEHYWSRARANDIALALRAVEPAIVTTPNFSVFNDVPRWDNFHSMKRIAICWYELASAGLSTALHVNSRTEHDWRRWCEFLKAHIEIGAIAYEFGTGAASPERGAWHAQCLCKIPAAIDRPLNLIVRGGSRHIRQFRRAFANVTFVSAEPFIRTIKRSKLFYSPPLVKTHWRSQKTDPGQPLDQLLSENVAKYCSMVEQIHF